MTWQRTVDYFYLVTLKLENGKINIWKSILYTTSDVNYNDILHLPNIQGIAKKNFSEISNYITPTDDQINMFTGGCVTSVKYIGGQHVCV